MVIGLKKTKSFDKELNCNTSYALPS